MTCGSDISGILVVDKQSGMTSHDVVDLVRRRFSLKKVGHAGTLDPDATGVLVLLLGKATKLSSKLIGEDKEYVASMKLGETTDTGDSSGKVVSVSPLNVTEEEISGAFDKFRGEIEQVPPMVSAKKVNGKPLYKFARKGIHVDRPARKVTIKELEILRIRMPLVEFRTLCSKGTYIRQLASDIGDLLGCGAHLTGLRRTRSGDFTLERAVSPADIKNMGPESLYENTIRIQEN